MWQCCRTSSVRSSKTTGMRPSSPGCLGASGGIESVNQCISHVHLNSSAACWYVEKASQMSFLHFAKYNCTFDRMFDPYPPQTQAALSATTW
jgi:hypothetical protein